MNMVINRTTKGIDQSLVERFSKLPVANVSDCMHRLFSAGAGLRPIRTGATVCGPAVTVKTAPGDNLFVHHALDVAKPGEVVVVDAGGDMSNAIIGEMMVLHAKTRRLGGIVIFGAVRDFDALSRDDFPVFALGATHRGPFKNGPGSINVPIAIEGMVIEAGDLVLGDGDGVLSVPLRDADAIYAKAEAKHREEIRHSRNIMAGTSDRSWIATKLQSLGCAVGNDS